MTIEYNVLEQFKPFLLGYCNCGCDKDLYPWDSRGRIRRYLKRHNVTGVDHPRWNGGITHDESGYELTLSPNHPFRTYENYVRTHRLVMEQHIGRYLTREEVVHHIDGNIKNNNIKNLMLFKDNPTHMSIILKKDMSDRICYICNSNITKTDKKGFQRWWKYKDGWECYYCGKEHKREEYNKNRREKRRSKSY